MTYSRGTVGIQILLGNGDGTFRFGEVYSLPDNGVDVYVLLGNGDGTFQAAVPYAHLMTSMYSIFWNTECI